MSDYITSLIRTGVGLVVGTVVGWLVAQGVLDEGASAEAITSLTAAVVFLVNGIWYAVARKIETALGWPVFGLKSQPGYKSP
jgi:hypothetical protein